MKRSIKSVLILLTTILIGFVMVGCDNEQKAELPILGRKQYQEVNGSIDTIYHTIPDFQFVDQDSMVFNQEAVDGKIYVADFFFGTCPTICPVMKQQMLRVYDKFKDNPNFLILSHTIDPEHDTVAYLKDYAEKIGVTDNQTWHFLTGIKDEIYDLGTENGYMVPVGEDKNAPGGFIHSGAFILVDGQRRIRGVYDGTKKLQVDELIADIPIYYLFNCRLHGFSILFKCRFNK
jgi:protein SCO1